MDDTSEEEVLGCLIRCSDSCYRTLLAGPRLVNKLTPSRWENVRPSALYDLTNLHTANSQQRRRTKRNSSNQYPLARGAVSLPNLRTTKVAPSHKEFSETYMSGYLDDNFSYVHPGGLSERSGTIDEHKLHKESPTHHYNAEPLKQRQTSQSVSTHTLTLDSVFASRLYAAQMDSRTRSEISKIVAMQLRSDVLAEQLFVESRLRNLDLNGFPLLGMGNSGSLESARGKSLSISARPIINSSSHNNIQAQKQQQSHKKREKRQRKQQESKFPPPLDWCPISIQETADVPFSSPQHQRAAIEGSMHNHHHNVMRFGSLRGNGLMGLSSGAGSGSIPLKQSASIEPQKVGERRKKRRSVRSYFGQEEFALENSIPKSEMDHGRHGIPVVVPVLDQGPVTRTKQVNKLTTLHRLPSKFSPNSSLNFANTIS